MKKSSTIEIINRYETARACNGLLYMPVESKLAYRQTRRYEVSFSGADECFKRFVHDVLLDEASEELYLDSSAAIKPYRFLLDVYLKPGLLDLEKEHILAYFRELSDPGFALDNLLVVRRFYFIGNDNNPTREVLVKDIVNPAIHSWKVIDA